MPGHYEKKVAKKAKKKKPHDPGADNPVKNPYTGTRIASSTHKIV